MRYLRYIACSPKLIAQLLLLLGLAGLIGGTGLVGLFAARDAVTEITTRQVPAVAHLLNAERDIAQANYAGLGAVIDPEQQRRVLVDLPLIRSLSAAASDEFRQFQIDHDHAAAQAPLVAESSQLLARWRGLSVQAQLLGKARAPIPPALIVAAFAIDDSTIVRPLSRDLSLLVRINTEAARKAKDGALSAMHTATLVLCGTIVLAVLLAGGFQVAISVREHRRKILVQQSADLVLLIDAQGTILSASPSYERLLGYVPSALVGRDGLEFLHPDDRPSMGAALARRVKDVEGSQEHETRFLHADGTYRWLAVSGVNKLHDPLVGGIVLTSRDITARKMTEAALEFQATHDALTTLPNRFLLQESIERALKGAVADQTP
ncbi:MAG: PAS domain S-box protein, partial [Chloroflexota bacterium]